MFNPESYPLQLQSNMEVWYYCDAVLRSVEREPIIERIISIFPRLLYSYSVEWQKQTREGYLLELSGAFIN